MKEFLNSGNIILKDCNNRIVNKKRFSLSAILLAIHVALTPIHQALLTSSGSTVNKYLVILIIGVMVLENKSIRYVRNDLKAVLPFILWISLTLVWTCSRSGTVSSLITIFSHIALLIMCSGFSFSGLEKQVIRYALIIASVIYAISLIASMVGGDALRATISLGMNDTESDQNVLSVNIGVAVLIALDNYKKENIKLLKYFNIISIFVILSGIFSTGSRGGAIATIVSLLFLLFKLYPGFTVKKVFLLILGVAFTIYILSDYSFLSEYVLDRYNSDAIEGNSGRTEIWSKYFEMLINKPEILLIGGGYGMENRSYSLYFSNNWPPATHNDYLSLLVSSGIIGLFLMIYIIRYCWKQAKFNESYLGQACIISALISAFSLNVITRYGFWNSLIFALICI